MVKLNKSEIEINKFEGERFATNERVDKIEKMNNLRWKFNSNKEKIHSELDNLTSKLVVMIPANVIFIRSVILTFILFVKQNYNFLIFFVGLLELVLYFITILKASIKYVKRYKNKKENERSIINWKILSTIIDILAFLSFLLIIFSIIITDENIDIVIFEASFSFILIIFLYASYKLKKFIDKKVDYLAYKMMNLSDDDENFIISMGLK